MKTVRHFTPHPDLSHLIRFYSIRELNPPDVFRLPSSKGSLLNFVQSGEFASIEKEGTDIIPMSLALVGEQSKYNRDIVLKSPLKMWAIQFYPHAIHVLFGLDMTGLINNILELKDLSDPLSEKLEILFHQDYQEETIPNSLDQLFLEALKSSSSNTNSIKALSKFILQIHEPEQDIRIQELCEDLNLSERQIERLMLTFVGLRPKEYIRTIRFRDLIYRNPELNKQWTGLSYESGYFDQSHLIREFKHFTGLTPGAYQKMLRINAELTY